MTTCTCYYNDPEPCSVCPPVVDDVYPYACDKCNYPLKSGEARISGPHIFCSPCKARLDRAVVEEAMSNWPAYF